MNHLVARLRVRALGMATRLVPAPTPFMVYRAGVVAQLVRMIADRGARSALVVTNAVLLELKVVDPVLVAVGGAGIKARVFSDVEPDPTIDVVMEGVARLRKSRADVVLAVGGGSPIDAAKAIVACRAMSLRSTRVIVHEDLPRVYEDRAGHRRASNPSPWPPAKPAWPSPRRAWGTFMPFRTRSACAIYWNCSPRTNSNATTRAVISDVQASQCGQNAWRQRRPLKARGIKTPAGRHEWQPVQASSSRVD